MRHANRQTIRRDGRRSSNIYLTFDDGPDPHYTGELLALLSHYQVPATFFLLGTACENNPTLTRHIAAADHDIACHGYTHSHPWRISASQARAEVKQGFFAVRAISGRTPKLFRPPFGRRRYAMVKQARQLEMTTVLWSRSGMDWGIWGTATAIARRLNRGRGGDIVLLHDGAREKNTVAATLTALPRFMEQARDRGLVFAPLRDLIQRRNQSSNALQAIDANGNITDYGGGYDQ